MTNKLISVKGEMDIPEEYRNTPIAKLILCHNQAKKGTDLFSAFVAENKSVPFFIPSDRYERAEILTLMCMDNRQLLRLPRNFSFIVRNSGGTRNGVSFSISFAAAVGGIRHIAVIGHSDCMMVNLESKRSEFVRGLSECGGWEMAIAENYFLDSCVLFKKKDMVDSVISEAELIRSQYPGIVVAPLFYSLEDDLLYLIEEK